MSIDPALYKQIGIALALGLLIGLERGWNSRQREEGLRVAGIRTFGLVSLLGAGWGLIAGQIGVLLLGFGFLGFSLLVVMAYLQRLGERDDIGITTTVALLLTFVLGAVAVMGHAELAAATAVIVTFLLGLKPVLHAWLDKLSRDELYATLKLLLISVVLLPILPDRGFGPWQALNPYQIWWMVVLIAAISYAGYFAIRIAGTRQGTLLTGVFGGLASSTAVTLTLSRLSRTGHGIADPLAAAILAACATMFIRTLVIASLFNPSLLSHLSTGLLLMATVTYLAAFVFWRRSKQSDVSGDIALGNPFQLVIALQFGALLALIMLLSKAAQAYVGDAGIYLLSAASGLADVDAITLSLSQMSRSATPLNVATLGIIIASVINSAVKAGMTAVIGGKALGLRVSGALLGAVASGLLLYWYTVA